MHNFMKNLKDPALYGKDAVIMSNIGVKAKAFDTDIYGHIDHIVIDSYGNLHMYIFKAAMEPYSKWST